MRVLSQSCLSEILAVCKSLNFRYPIFGFCPKIELCDRTRRTPARQAGTHGQHTALGPSTALSIVRDLADCRVLEDRGIEAGCLFRLSLNPRHAVIFCILASPCMISVGTNQ